MRKLKIDKKYMKISLYAFAVLSACIILSKFLDNIGGFFASAANIFSGLKELLITFIYGFFIAFFFTPIVNFMENFLSSHFKKLHSKPKFLRNITILITYVIFIGCFTWITIYIMPTLISSFNALFTILPNSVDNMIETLKVNLNNFDKTTAETILNAAEFISVPIKEIIESLPTLISQYFNADNFTGFLNSTFSIFTAVFNFIVGIIISFYMLSYKDELAANGKKVCLTIFKEGTGEIIIQNMQRVNMIFQNFIIGKLLDAIVLGIMCFIGVKIMRIPYALIISVVIGITNMIPYVGPFIGTIPAVLVVLLIDPIKAFGLLIYILIIQQIDNYYICPKILGEPTGLTPLEVLLAICIGAYFGNVFGMFLGVPVVASFKLFITEAINRKFREKYPHGSPDFFDDDDDLWLDDEDDFVEDIPDD